MARRVARCSERRGHHRSRLSRRARCDQRFNIPLKLLDELVAGVTIDLDHAADGAPDTYATFADLYRYCYLVASVVGLVCIRIFGYRDLRAEKLAEETGIAFQLTNILRDVAEDAARNRVYLPLKNLAAARRLARFAASSPALRAAHARRARAARRHRATAPNTTTAQARLLLPLIDPESRPALWVLVSIYHALLKRIERADYDVFTRRASCADVAKARHPRRRPRLDGLGAHLRLLAPDRMRADNLPDRSPAHRTSAHILHAIT